MGLIFGRLETPHREKPLSREVQPWSRDQGGFAVSWKCGQEWTEGKVF